MEPHLFLLIDGKLPVIISVKFFRRWLAAGAHIERLASGETGMGSSLLPPGRRQFDVTLPMDDLSDEEIQLLQEYCEGIE